MSKQTDFADARERHWSDAEVLLAGGCWANADHLYGFSAECGLKLIMQRLGMRLDDGLPPREYREHVNVLWRLFQDFAERHDGARYLQHLPDGEPFADWSVADRYARRSAFGEELVAPHREAARTVGRVAAIVTQDDP